MNLRYKLALVAALTLAASAGAQSVGTGDVRIIAQWMIGNTFKASTTLVHVVAPTLMNITPILPLTLVRGQSVCPVATGRDQFGNPFTGAPIKWTSSDSSLIRIGVPTALITTGGPPIICPVSDTTIAPPLAPPSPLPPETR